MTFAQLPDITGGKILSLVGNLSVTNLLTDSRKAIISEGSVFFALAGTNHDGHRFVNTLFNQGVRQFVVEQAVPELEGKANVLQVESSLEAIQAIVASHRSQLKAPVVGITGSNGKTIIKEWLYQLLSPEFKIAKNPASYNSQLGVPLSVWQMGPHHTLGVFEAGISKVGEMKNLQHVLKPTIGMFTNIGSAHDEGFSNVEEKVREKLLLFSEVEILIYCKDHKLIDEAVRESGIHSLTWGSSDGATVRVVHEEDGYRVTYGSSTFPLSLPFSDSASIENCLHCVVVMLHLGISPDQIEQRIASLRAIPMRLELKEGINNCQIIDDTYNSDLAGLQVSLDFLAHQQQRRSKRVILSDIRESGLPDHLLVRKIAHLLSSARVSRFIGIGPILSAHRGEFPSGSQFYPSTEAFLKSFDTDELHDEVILVKGARIFMFEKIVAALQRKVHGTVMEIDLGALVHNLNYFKARVQPSTRVMAMVKAFAYGSGSNEIANVMQYHKVDYLGVAYADEGIELRRNNIAIPVMVMNPAEESFAALIKYDLEPEIYSFRILRALAAFLGSTPCKIHLKIDTGMRRLGFEKHEIDEVVAFLLDHPNIRLASIFSHLAGADEVAHDDFSREQGRLFNEVSEFVSQRLGYRPIRHLLNSSGILRFPEFQFDMVRVGIALYGINPAEGSSADLKPVTTLKTIISQIKQVRVGETIGYGRKGKAERDITIATIAIGYADGFSRAFSRGVGRVLINGKVAPVIGNVCMDMTMVDISGIPAREGDEVIIFGRDLPIAELARSVNTIPYELLTSTSERVKRVFVAESI